MREIQCRCERRGKVAESADFRRGNTGRGSRSGDEQALQGAEAGVPAGVLNSALSNQGSSLARGAVDGGGKLGVEGWRSRSEGGTGVWMGACGCTNINSALLAPEALRAGWLWSAEGKFDERDTIGVDWGDERAAEDAEEIAEMLEEVDVDEDEAEAEEWVRKGLAGR